MIVNLDPLEKIFDKVIVDLNITEHDVDPRAFTSWAMEAMEHIGGLNRVESINSLLSTSKNILTEFDDFEIFFPNGVLNFNEMRYYKLTMKDSSDYVLARPQREGEVMSLDDSEKEDVIFRREYLIEAGARTTVKIVINRRNGYVLCLGCRLPYIEDDNGVKAFFIPALATYQEAVYWYITMKILWRDVFRGRNKGNQHQYAAGMWNNLKKSAYAELMMPDTWELEDYADELSLAVSYTGLNKRKVTFGRDNELYYKYKEYWKPDRSKIPTYKDDDHKPEPHPQDYPFNI